MSLLTEVAARADVPVEGVVRVVTRQPVSRRIAQRVVKVLDALDPEQQRAVERLARAGSVDVVTPRPDVTPREAVVAAPDADSLPAIDGTDLSVRTDPLALRLHQLLEEINECLNEIRRDHVSDRQDRVDDLAVLVDLMTTGWRGVDRRLGRVERTLARLEAGRERPRPLVAERRDLDVPAAASAAPEGADVAVQELEGNSSSPGSRGRMWRRLTPVPILIVAAIATAFAASELLPSSDDEPRLLPAAEGTSLRAPAPQTSLSATTGGPATPAPTTPATGTTPSRTRTTPATGTTPSRTFAWPARAGSTYYLVRIFRGNALIHEARPVKARLVVPTSVKFTPGTYRWSVRPGVGPPAQNRLSAPIVDSAFEVSR